MVRHCVSLAIFGICWALFSGSLHAAEGALDPTFSKYSFDQWFSGAPQSSLKWSARAMPVVLSVHQRLIVRLQIQVDGAEAAKRRGEGQLLFFFQLTDSQGRVFQDHSTYELEKVEDGIRSQDLVCVESAFVMPGDYQLSFAILDNATGEHAVKKSTLHVLPLRPDALPEAWREMRTVEFIAPLDKPESWFLPPVKGKLNLPVPTRHPVRIELLMNLTQSELARRFGAQDAALAALFPTLKAASRMQPSQGSVNISLLDLERRRVAYHQENAADLDFEKIAEALAEPTSGTINVKALEQRNHTAAFFVNEVASRANPAPSADDRCAVILFSTPTAFDSAQDPPESGMKPSPGCPVYYVRYHLQFTRQQPYVPGPPMRGRRSRFGGIAPPGSLTPAGLAVDQLVQFLKPLDPHVFDVNTADEIRKALATIISDISRL